MSNAVEVDKEFPYHYKFESFSYDMFEDNYPKKQIMVSETLSNEYHMDIGDELIIDNSIWTICSIFANEYHNRTIIFPENSGVLENCERFSPISIVQFSKEYLSKHSEITEILENSKFTTLQHREKYTLNSLRTYALFIIIFAVIFIVLSILNCYLVFFANINYKRKIYGIKRTYGASFAICFGDVFIENGIFSLLAFHIACFLVHMFRYNIPSFFYTEVSLTVYGFGIAVVFIITVLYSLLIFKTISNESTIKLLKE
jgi:ABC-type antimicrobial peptide transport system permease subunit